MRKLSRPDIPITSPDFWQDEDRCTLDVLKHVFRPADPDAEPIPLLESRLDCLREAGKILHRVCPSFLHHNPPSSTFPYLHPHLTKTQSFNSSIPQLIRSGQRSAITLINHLSTTFSCFRDEFQFEGQTVRFLKRAQILIADLWACFDGKSWGEFDDIDQVTAFAGPSPLNLFYIPFLR